MPELPEVETTRRGIAPHLENQFIINVIVRESRLRWCVPDEFSNTLVGQQIQSIQRRGKYLLVQCTDGHLIIHLGMSGSLRILSPATPPQKHDHIDFIFSQDLCLRYHDPRRFGCVLWTTDSVLNHPLLAHLGIEPLCEQFNGEYLYLLARKRQIAVKSFIMNSHIVVGVGNIYANEALFLAGLHPNRAAKEISLLNYQRLADSIKHILTAAIELGGTTLRDFTNSAGNPGYFKQSLQVYGRAGEVCRQCNSIIKQEKIGQRASYYCPTCQG